MAQGPSNGRHASCTSAPEGNFINPVADCPCRSERWHEPISQPQSYSASCGPLGLAAPHGLRGPVSTTPPTGGLLGLRIPYGHMLYPLASLAPRLIAPSASQASFPTRLSLSCEE